MDHYDPGVLRYAAKRWLLFFATIILFSFTLLGYRLVDLQVIRHDQLSNAARGNTIRTVERAARRGDILDRRGNLLATSLFVKTVCADPSMIGEYRPHIARTLAPLLEMDEDPARQAAHTAARSAMIMPLFKGEFGSTGMIAGRKNLTEWT